MPYSIVVGRDFEKEGVVELRNRATGERTQLPYEDAVDKIAYTIISAKED